MRVSIVGIFACGMVACPVKLPDDVGTEGSSGGVESGATEAPTVTTGPVRSTTGGSETTTTGGSGSATTGEGGCEGFLCPPDMGEAIPACDPMAQDCPDGEKCVWYAPPGELRRRGAARCVAVVGDREPFAACNLPNGVGPEISDDCGADGYCLNAIEVPTHGFCAPYPKPGTTDCGDHPGTTYATENGSIFPHACLHYVCDPRAPETCPDGLRCGYYPSWLYGGLQCLGLPATGAPVGAACDYEDCGPGKLCLPAEFVPGCDEARCCTEWCDLSAPTCSDAAASCDPLGFEVESGLETLGACVVPGSLDD
jgi:hypothetical protein